MVDRAGHFLASRSLTALIVIALVASAFAGMFIVGQKATASGDLNVIDETYVIQDVDQLVDGNVLVGPDGVLKIIDGSLSVISNFGERFSVTVGAGGTLILDHGVLTTYLDQIDPWAKLDLIVEDGGEVIATNDSALMFPGTIALDNGAVFTLRDSTITNLPDGVANEFVVPANGITLDSVDDGPTITITDSTLKLFDSAIDEMPEHPTDVLPATNLTLNGASTLLSVNSYIGVDFEPDPLWTTHNMLEVNGESQVYLYGTQFEEYVGDPALRVPAYIVGSVGADPAYPTNTREPDDTTSDENVGALEFVDSWVYMVDSGEVMAMDTWDVGGLPDVTPLSSATLVATYSVGPSYTGSNAVGYRLDGVGAYTPTSIQPTAGDAPGTVATSALNPAVISDVGDLRTMDVEFDNTGGGDTVQFENLWVVFSVGGDVYMYRWLNATVADEYGVPIVPDENGVTIENVTIDAVFTGSTTLEGQEAFYYTSAGISTAPEADVLDYMGETAETFKTVKEGGKAVIPYLTDISDDTTNSRFVGTYAFTGSAEIDSVVHSSTEAFSFVPYPAMDYGDQYADLKVEITGVSVPSPDISKWLVVPYETDLGDLVTSLVIEDMTYYHAGDVIVASNGELTVIDSEFLLVQEYANERTIYVDGNGVLRFENAVVESELPIDIIVQGFGTLEVINSEMNGLSIYAREDATIILDESMISDGDITTSWNSRATLEVYDCMLDSSPVLSGSTVGAFTNTSVPSIEVEDDAEALIYRWIHVTIWDGNSKPLPGVDVFARFFVNDSLWTSTLSDASGVARLNCLGTILTASGSTFVGNYRVNATYWYDDSIPYESDQAISVGVAPYTEPLGMNATYALLTISTALPDLDIDTLAGVECTPESPKYQEYATITAYVENVGVSVAYNVYVNFTDNDHLFATVVWPSILPNETALVNATWYADYPLDPQEHSIKVYVDQADMINEIDDSPAIGYLSVTVQNLPDLEVSLSYGAGTEPAAPVVDSTCTVYVNVYNAGTNTAYNVPVAFYNATIDMVAPENLIGTTTIATVVPGLSPARASVTWVPEMVGTHFITAIVNENFTIPESDEENNNVTFDVQVYDYPDLELFDYLLVTGLTTVASGDEVVVRATIRNLEEAPVVNPEVALYIDGDWEQSMEVPGTFIAGSSEGAAEFHFIADDVTEDTLVTISLVANPNRTYEEQSFDNNEVNGTITVTDVRPDLQITDTSIYVTFEGNNVTGEKYGRTVVITVEVENLGSRDATNIPMEVGIRTVGILNYTIGETMTVDEVLAGEVTVVTVQWLINLTVPGAYMIWAEIDTTDVIDEPDDTNNYGEFDFTVEELSPQVIVETESNEYETGALVIATIRVFYEDGVTAVGGLPGIVPALYDSSGERIDQTLLNPVTTGSEGTVTVTIEIPDGLPSGQYTVGVLIQDVEYMSSPFSITGEAEGGIPLLIWILVLVIIVLVVVGFTLYTYIYGLGKLVECGECGQFIPAASKRCPKCGVEFEAGTMKCSECGQWVPSSATECPNCGVKFVGEPEAADLDYLDRMRAEYESMVSEYRELAKEELGKKFTDKRFEVWWKSQSTYVSFDDWLAKEEEKRKEGPIPCSVCGTLNPREATVCHKCGTIFAPAEAAVPPEMPPEVPPEQPPTPPPRAPPGGAGAAAPPKTVVRRPIDRKVVPKKIIRAPADKDEQ